MPSRRAPVTAHLTPPACRRCPASSGRRPTSCASPSSPSRPRGCGRSTGSSAAGPSPAAARPISSSSAASRSTSTLYPGPLSRAAHLAFLSIATERGLPLENPITWTWRDLCRRMGIEYSGRTVQHLKAAIKATSFLSIESQYAVYAKPDGRMIRTQEEGLRLYDRFAFVGSLLPDGGKAEANGLWLADWFLQNLNAMHTAPLDYELWRHLDGQSPIASRLYEFLIINLYGSASRTAHQLRDARAVFARQGRAVSLQRGAQLDPAFRLLTSAAVIDAAEWAESRRSVAQLHIRRGKMLAAPHAAGRPLRRPAGRGVRRLY